MLRIDEEARDPPQLLARDRWGDLAVGTSRIDPREFLLAAVLAPTDRRAAVIDQDRVGAPAADQRSLVQPISPLPLLAGRPSTKGIRPLVEDAPTSSLLDGERFKIRKSTNAQLADRIRFPLHDGAFVGRAPK